MKKGIILILVLCSGVFALAKDDVANSVTSNVVTLTTANVAYQVLAENAYRRKATIINDSDTTIYINEGFNTPTTNFGIRLNANGGSYEINLMNPSLKAWYAICASAGKKARITDGSHR